MSPRRSTPWPAGAPCWADVSTPDLDASKAFYSGLLGWEYGEGDPAYGGYALATSGGADVSGISPVMEGQQPGWTLYFASDDVAATASAVAAHGGMVLADVMEIGPMGSMMVGADPSGAAFGIWQAGEMIGTAAFNEPGGLVWEDLRSKDADAARAFYGAVLGWDFHELQAAGPEYTTFHHAGEEAPMGGLGGMMGMDSFPSHWIVYWGVADVDAAVAWTEAHGGHVLSPGFDTDFGRMGALTDPFGASFWVASVNPEIMPDRTD